MKVGIYVETVKAAQQTGISRYTRRLVETLVERYPRVQFYLYHQRVARQPVFSWLADHDNVTLRGLWTPADWVSEHPRLWWHYYLPLVVRYDRLDLFHGPNHFLPRRLHCPMVVTIHDLAYFFMQVHGAGLDKLLTQWTLDAMEQADAVVCVSHSTANDVIEQGIDEHKVCTVYQGYEPKPQQQLSADCLSNLRQWAEGLAIQQPYLLFLSTIQPRKNVLYLIKEFAACMHSIPHQLVLAGAPGESQAEAEQLVRALGLQERVVFTGFISDNQRHYLYLHADVFVYPSRYEGFGLVILEAMSYGIPVITGNNSSLPEAAGDAAMKVDISAKYALASSIKELTLNRQLMALLRSKGLKHCHSFSWDRSADEMMSVYERTQSI